MTYRPERERAGFCKVWFSDGSASVLKRNEYEPICTALRNGNAWHEAEDIYGDQVFLRLSAVSLVMDASPAAIAASDADGEEAAAYKRTHGEE